MGVVLHWFLPTNGDSRTDLSLGNAVGVAGSRVREGGAERAPDVEAAGGADVDAADALGSLCAGAATASAIKDG